MIILEEHNESEVISFRGTWLARRDKEPECNAEHPE